MKIIYKKGDLLQCNEKYILHGCNACGKMGSGVAKLIRAKYPSAFLAYKASEQHNGMRLGDVTYAEQDDGKVILNGVTQEFYGRQAGVVYVDYWAIKEVMQAVNFYILNNENFAKVAMPKIGAGLGGGDWRSIAAIIEEESINFQPIVYEL